MLIHAGVELARTGFLNTSVLFLDNPPMPTGNATAVLTHTRSSSRSAKNSHEDVNAPLIASAFSSSAHTMLTPAVMQAQQMEMPADIANPHLFSPAIAAAKPLDFSAHKQNVSDGEGSRAMSTSHSVGTPVFNAGSDYVNGALLCLPQLVSFQMLRTAYHSAVQCKTSDAQHVAMPEMGPASNSSLTLAACQQKLTQLLAMQPWLQTEQCSTLQEQARAVSHSTASPHVLSRLVAYLENELCLQCAAMCLVLLTPVQRLAADLSSHPCTSVLLI